MRDLRSWGAVGLLLLLLLGGLYWWGDDASPPDASPADVVDRGLPIGPSGSNTSSASAVAPLETLALAEELNANHRTVQDDLRELDGVFAVWQTNFLREGNPVGDNREITAALTGQNPLRLAFLRPDHPAIQAGQLCDRWGTPFFFHQLDGFRMEILSAGPDQERGTADDAILTP
jgi:hypothetical protein